MIKRMSLLVMLALTGCVTTSSSQPTTAVDLGWSIGYTSPPLMKTWIETIDVEDMGGRVFTRIGSGIASMGYGSDPDGWHPPQTLGGGRIVTGAALPKRLYVRWQSLVEPQTYRATFDIPERARQLMRLRDQNPVSLDWYYRDYLILELAPGGWVKVWIMSPAGVDSDVLCVRGEIEPKGPYLGESNGVYAYSLDQLAPAIQQYLKANRIPYESWHCDQ